MWRARRLRLEGWDRAVLHLQALWIAAPMAKGLAIPALASLLDRLAFPFSFALAGDQSLLGLLTLVVDVE
eukprot:14645245-Heterocapsa_arctica.AAC.1